MNRLPPVGPFIKQLVDKLAIKLRAIIEGLISAIELNYKIICAKVAGRKTFVLRIGAASQLMHVESVLEILLSRPITSQISFFVLIPADEVDAVLTHLERLPARITSGSVRAERLLVACDFMLSVDQGAKFPWVGCKIRACSFHGQPSKGNVYQRFNYRQINTLFLYGPLMRNYYLRTKADHPEWPDIQLLEVGQPTTDRLVNQPIDRSEVRRRLGLDPARFTVIYAPSFEYCSSLATDGNAIIETLLEMKLNLIVKPHPAFYNAAPFDDEFNRDCPRAAGWREAVDHWSATSHCIFRMENTLDGDLALAASDLMLTDFSGIAFNGIALDLGMIYWECPQFYHEYLPRRYGVDGEIAKSDLACNVGRDCGIVVKNVSELRLAVRAYEADPALLADARREVRDELYFNLGHASETMANAIEGLLFGEQCD